jgi:hypothetical protein
LEKPDMMSEAALIRARWYDDTENGGHGRDEIAAIAKRLAEPDLRR